MKLTALSLSLFIALNAWSQHDKVILTISPLAAADFVTFAAIQAGVETKLSSRFSLHNEIGIKYSDYFSRKADTAFIPSKGFRAKTEIRFYFEKEPLKRVFGNAPKSLVYAWYLGFNLFYQNDHHNATMNYRTPDSVYLKDNFAVKKSVWGFNIVIGLHEPIGKRFLVDAYAGFGPRFRYITTSNKELIFGIDTVMTAKDMNVCTPGELSEAEGGYSVAATLTAGIRFGYRL